MMAVVPVRWLWFQYDGCGSSMMAVVPVRWRWFQYDGCGSVRWLWFQYDGCGSSTMAVVPVRWRWFQLTGCVSPSDSSEAGSQGSRCGGMTSDQQSKVKVSGLEGAGPEGVHPSGPEGRPNRDQVAGCGAGVQRS